MESWVWRFHSCFPFVSYTSFDERTQSNSTEPFRFIKFKNRTFDVIRRAIELNLATIMAKQLLTATTRNLTLVKPVSETAPKTLFWITTCVPGFEPEYPTNIFRKIDYTMS